MQLVSRMEAVSGLNYKKNAEENKDDYCPAKFYTRYLRPQYKNHQQKIGYAASGLFFVRSLR